LAGNKNIWEIQEGEDEKSNGIEENTKVTKTRNKICIYN